MGKKRTRNMGTVVVCRIDEVTGDQTALIPVKEAPSFSRITEAEKWISNRGDDNDYGIIRFVKAMKTREIRKRESVELSPGNLGFEFNAPEVDGVTEDPAEEADE